MSKTQRKMRDKQVVKAELAKAEKKYCELNAELLDIENEEESTEGDSIFLVPVQYMVTAKICVSAADMTTPVGEYLDDSWVFNPDGKSALALRQGYVR